ncbi:MAG TPA: YfiR family protein [Steroidobacteraceae bacterium]|nr:YfiR family protein [Steroidobacteraceae bacterium]
MGPLRARIRATAVALLIAAGLLGGRPALAVPTAQQVEAVFLFYFSQFVDWPQGAFADERSPIVIGVLGADPFDGALDQAVAGERVNGRSIIVRRLKSIADATGCHILYISSSEAPQLPQILSALKGRNVLTVSDLGNFVQSGGMIRFVLIDEHVRLLINPAAAQAAGLKLSSKLLRAAAAGGPGGEG